MQRENYLFLILNKKYFLSYKIYINFWLNDKGYIFILKGQRMEENIFIDNDVKIGKNVKIHPFNVIKGNCVIGDNTIIFPFNYIENCNIGKNCEISYSHLQDVAIQNYVKVGPFSRIRPGSIIKDNCKIGNFVEIKNSEIKSGVKASHLSYIGDASVGENTNVGCGVIFANYNGKIKNHIRVGKNCFIGSNSNLIAPLNISDNTYICAGTTLTKDTKKNDFVIGRERETIKPNRASRYLKGD